MISHPQVRRRLAAAAVLAVLAAPSARAQVTVFDPSNYAQNVMTAARELEQVQHQITQLQNQAQMLINQAHNLASLPYTALSQLQGDITRTQSLLAQAQNISFSTAQINTAFQTQYGSTSLSTSNAALVAQAQARWQTSVNAWQESLNTQAGVVANLASTSAEMSALVGASQGAAGSLQAAQSGNQLVAVVAKELADLIAVIAAQSRAQALSAADKATATADAAARLSQFMTPGTYAETSVAMFH